MIVYLDIETAPHDARPGAEPPQRAWDATAQPEALLMRGSVPRNITDPAKIRAREEEIEATYRAAVSDWLAGAPVRKAEHRARAIAWWGEESLVPVARAPHIGGVILCAAWAIDDGPVELAWGEVEALDALEKIARQRPREWVGHNIRGFDAPFIASRALIRGGAPKLYGNFRSADKWGVGRHVTDTLDLLPVTRYQGRPSGTSRLCDWVAALGIATQEGGGGAEVLGQILAFDTAAIAAHCRADVAELRALHRRLVGGGE